MLNNRNLRKNCVARKCAAVLSLIALYSRQILKCCPFLYMYLILCVEKLNKHIKDKKTI
jgi:hypothetical protein